MGLIPPTFKECSKKLHYLWREASLIQIDIFWKDDTVLHNWILLTNVVLVFLNSRLQTQTAQFNVDQCGSSDLPTMISQSSILHRLTEVSSELSQIRIATCQRGKGNFLFSWRSWRGLEAVALTGRGGRCTSLDALFARCFGICWNIVKNWIVKNWKTSYKKLHR